MNRFSPTAARFKNRLSAEAGFALVIALGLSLALGISGTTAMIYSTSNFRSTSVSKEDRRAYSMAEAGLAYAYSTLHNAGDATLPGAVPQRSEQVEGGTITWYGTLDTSTNVWTLTGEGRVSSPANGAPIIRRVRARARVGSSGQGSGGNAIWNYVYAEAPTSCTTIGNSVLVNVPLYVRGNLCLQNSARMTGLSLQVGGTLSIAQSATVGETSVPIPEAHVGGGCSLDGGALQSPCTASQHVYALVRDNQVTDLSKPPVDLPYWYENSKPGPRQVCTTKVGTPPAFDNDTTLNRSLTSPVNLTPSSAYDCQVRDAQGTLIGRLAWNPNAKALTILGTMFFDGDILFADSAEAYYQGKATIYAAGKVTLGNSAKVCGSTGCNTTWAPLVNLLALISGSSTDEIGFRVMNSGILQGATYAVNDYSEENSATVWGPIIARQIYFLNSTVNHYVPIGTILPGMPQADQEAATITNEPESWS